MNSKNFLDFFFDAINLQKDVSYLYLFMEMKDIKMSINHSNALHVLP